MPRRILIVRNDKLGDFMLSWPALRLLKERVPGATIAVLVRDYTREAASLCPWVDEVVIDPGPETDTSGRSSLIDTLRNGHFDAVITLFSTTRVGWACWRSGIPYRLAPATKLAQVFYNKRERQRRSRSDKPEWVYNLDLAVRFLHDHGMPPEPLPRQPYLSFPTDDIVRLRDQFFATEGLDKNLPLVFVHPGSGGSARNLSIEQYAALLTNLNIRRPMAVVVTAGPGEIDAARQLVAQVGSNARLLTPATLTDFARHIAMADLWISGSTGPLHIAGALNVPTVGFYPRRRSATPMRWQTLNTADRRLAFTPPEAGAEENMHSIDIDSAAREISQHFLDRHRPAR